MSDINNEIEKIEKGNAWEDSDEAVEIEITAKQIVKIKEKLNNILARHTGQPLEKVERDTDRDFYLSAEEAKEYGIVDEVIKTKE